VERGVECDDDLWAVLIYTVLWDDMCTFSDGCSGTVCAVGGQGREANAATAPLLANARIVNSLKCNSWTINLANLGRHAQLTRCFSVVAELLARSSATTEKRRVSCSRLPRLAN